MKSSHKEVDDKDNNNKNQEIDNKKIFVKRLWEKVEFTINQLKTVIIDQ